MDPLTIAAASGLRSRLESLDLLANNLANAATNGFKSDREFYNLYASAESRNSPAGPLGTLPVIEKQWTDFSQGTLQVTGNPLDIALSDKGFLVVNGPNGPLYTRNGSLRVLGTGELATTEGFAIQTAGGNSIRLAPEKAVEILTDGTVRQDGQTLGKIHTVTFKSTDSLRKAGRTCFQNVDASNIPTAADLQVQQGKVENSNVSIVEASMRLVGVMRQFEMLQKAIGISGEMNAKTIQEVAKINP